MSPHRSGARGRAAAAALLVVVTLLLAACGGDEGSGGSADAADGAAAGPADPTSDALDDVVTPTGQPVQALEPRGRALPDSRRVEGDGWRLDAPAEFQQTDTVASDGEPLVILEKPSGTPEVPFRVAVVRDVAGSDVAEQMFVLQGAKQAIGATGFVRSPLGWPGSREAVLAQWQEPVTTASGAEQVQVWQLAVEVDDDLGISVVGLGPEAGFADSGVVQVMESFVPRG